MDKLKKAAALLCCVLMITNINFAGADEKQKTVYQLLGDQKQVLTYISGTPEAGDEYIASDNRHYKIIRVDKNNKTADTEYVGAYQMPDVSWLEEKVKSAAVMRKAVAMYCTHSDESYTPTDGTESSDKRGGIFDVAQAFKKSMEKKGVKVYMSTDTHFPHDAGAYRRSRQTAVQLMENGVDAIIDIHRDGIPNPDEYETKIKGKDATRVRLLVGRSNQNSQANKQFAARLKAVADKVYPGLIKDIYIGKGTYNQDLMSQAILLEFGTYTNEKNDVIQSTEFMADVLYRTLYGGVTGAAGVGSDVQYENGIKPAAQENSGGWKGIVTVIGLLLAGLIVFALVQTGSTTDAMGKIKDTFREFTGGIKGKKKE